MSNFSSLMNSGREPSGNRENVEYRRSTEHKAVKSWNRSFGGAWWTETTMGVFCRVNGTLCAQYLVRVRDEAEDPSE